MLRGLSVTMFIGALISLGMGFYKMFVYENSEYSYGDKTNVYVGGDAYNYIINGTYTTAYFVLFGSLLIGGLLVELLLASKTRLVKETIEEIETEDGKPKSKFAKFMDEVEIR